MNYRYDDIDELDRREIFDPLCIERSRPMSDEESALAETLCQASTPGPLVIDDEADGDGALVVSLPDGRLIVSLTASVEQTESDGAIQANSELICKARHWLLRMLMDREQWAAERETLQHRISELETESSSPPQPR